MQTMLTKMHRILYLKYIDKYTFVIVFFLLISNKIITKLEAMNRKNKRCKECMELFIPMYNDKEQCCSIKCAIEFSKKKTLQKERQQWNKEKRERKENLKTYPEWMKSLQRVFNIYIRKKNKGENCISCNKNKGQMQCGHYISVKRNNSLRFEELNAHIQCSACNHHLHGNLINYRINLVKKIGLVNVEWLENKKNTEIKMTIQEIKEKIKYYKNKIKEL